MRKRKVNITAAICMMLLCAMIAGCVAAGPTSGQNDPPATTPKTTPTSTSTTAPTTPATTPSTPGSTQPTAPEPTLTQPTQPADTTARYTVTVEKKDETFGSESATMILVYNDRGDLLEYWNAYLKILYTYDSQGNVLSEKTYYQSGELIAQTDYTYDTDGRLLQTEGFAYSEVYTSYKTEYLYDDNGNLSGKKVYVYGELSEECTYDASGNLVEICDVRYGQRKIYTYTAEGKLQSDYTEKDGAPYSGWDYFYDDSGRLIRVERFIMSGDVRKELTNTFTYDENGRCIRYDMGGFQGEQSYEIYTYDTAGNMLSSEYHDYDGRNTGYYWTYDEAGRMTSWKSTNRQGTTIYTWEYDEQGNVCKLTQDTPGADITYSFCYTWPEAELTQQVWEEIASRIAAFAGVSVYTPERYARIYD